MEYIQAFKNYLLALRPTPSAITVKNYSLDVKHFVSWFESKYRQPFDPKAVTQDDIALFRREKNAELSFRSLDRHVSSLRKFFYFLKLQGVVSHSPLEKKTLSAEALAQADPFYFKQFKDFLYVYNAASLTIKNYIIDVKQFFLWAQETFPQEANLLGLLSGDLLAQYRDHLAGSGTFSPASINRKLSSLRKYVAWAKSQNLLENQSGLLNNPNEVANIPSTTASEMPKEERKAQSMNIEDSGPASQRGEQARMTTYSPFPPFRLAQKISRGINVAFDAVFIAPLALATLQGHRLLWTLKGKPLFTSQPWYQKIYFHARNTRPNWYKRYHSYALAHYFNWAILMIIMSIIGFGLYNTFVTKPQNSKPLLAATAPNRILSFQGRLTDSSNNPITTATNLRFGIYTDATSTGSALLWQEVDGVTPDSNGVFSVLLGKNSSIQQSLFANNANLYLGIAVGATAELTPREQLATVAFATNAETLQGLPPITQSGAGTSNVVLALNSSGNLSIGAASTFQTVGGAFTLSGDTLVLNTNSGTNGNITVAPDGQGFIDLQKPLVNSTQNNNISSAQGSVEVDDTLAILATSSGVSAVTINQNGTAPILSASTGGVAKFTIGNAGDITASHYNTAGGIFYADINGLFTQTTTGTNGQCLTSTGGTAPTWGTCGGASTNYWTLASGALYPVNETVDAFIGGTSTASAKFSFLNVSSGTPTASVSSGLNGVGTYITANGTLQTTNFQGLTLGGATTGNITVFGLGTGVVHSTAGVLSSSAVDLASSDVTGILPLNHGGTGANITGDQGGLVYFNSSTTLATLAHAATAGQCLLSGGTGTPTWANCSTASSNWWNVNQGALYPINDTFDLLLGGSGATTSAKFAVLNMTGSGTPTASVSSGLNGSATFITSSGTLQTTNNQGLTLGGTTTGSISFANNINSNIIPSITDTYNLGSASLEWNNLYVKNIVSTGSIAGFWQRNLGVLSPTSIADDLAIGGVSTSAAKFQVFGLTGNATTAGTLTFTSGGSQIQTTSNQPLTLGGNSTGNIILEPNNGSGIVTSDGNIIPGSTDTYNLGSSTLEWNNIFVKNIFASGNYAGFFQRNSGVLSPINITDDIAVGGTGTSSAKFQVFGNTGNATTAGNLTFNGNAVIAARNNTGLTIGDNQTGNITVFGLGTGVVHATSGVLSSGFVNLTSEVTGVLPIANGGTNTNSIAANGAIAYSNGSAYAFSAVGSSGQCLISNGSGAPSWTSCSGASSNWWNMSDGTLYPINQTFDLTLGSSDGTGSSASAKFAVLNMTGSGTPTASVSSGLNGAGTYITANGTLQTTNFQGLTIGGATTGNITLKPSNGIAGSSVSVFADLLPDATDTRNLGSSSLEWNNLYVKNIISSGNTAGFWQRILGVLSPANITDDLAIGGTGTSSAKFQVFGNTGNATTSGTLTFTNTGSQIQTTSNQPLTIGGSSTGGITLSPNNGSGIITLNGNVTENGTTFTIGNGSASTIQTTSNANLTLTAGSGNIDFFSASNNLTSGGNLTLAGTITLPNSNTITGIASAVQLTQGLTVNSAGSSTTHTNIDTSGNILPGTDLGANIGSNTLRWNNIFAGGNYDGFWQRFSGVISPFNNTDDLAIGGTGTSSAKFQIFGLTGNATTSGNLTFNGNGQIQTTNDQTLTLGGNTTGNISFGSNVASNILPYKTNTYDLGSLSLQWNNIYAHNIFQDGQPITQVWQRNLGSLSPLNITDDVLAGGTATTSAKFAVLNMTGSGTPTASVSSGLNGVGTYITSNGTLQTTSMQPLTVGGATTGPIQLSPKGTTGLYVDNVGNVGIGTTAPTAPLEVAGTIYGSSFKDRDNINYFIDPAAAGTAGAFNGNVGIGTTTTNDFKLEVAGNIGPTTDNSYDLGSNTLRFRNLYLSGNYDGFWQLFNGVLSPLNVTNDLVIGSTSTSSARFHAYSASNGGTNPAASASAQTATAALIVNNDGVGDVLAASSSSIPVFSIRANGQIVANQYSSAGGVFYTNSSGVFQQVSNASAHTVLHGGTTPTFSAVDLASADVTSILPIANGGTNANLTSELSNGGIVWSNATQLQILAASATAGQCLVSGGAATPSWTSCSGAASNWWNVNNGELFPINSTLDLTLGSSDGSGSSASAKFAVLNMTGSGTPTASVSSGLNGSGTYITANGTLQTTSFQGLTIGGTTTGNITLEPLGSGTGSTINLNAKTIDDNQSTATLFGTPTALTIGNSSGTTTFASNIDSSKATLTLFATPTTVNEGAVAQTFNVLGNFTAAALSADLVPTGNGSINLGSPSHYYGTVYAQNFIAPVSGGTSGFWQLTSNVLSPVNFWNDLAVGGNATGSATPFQVFATTVGVDTAGTATSSAGLSFRGTNTNIDLLNGSILNFKTSVGGDSGLSTVLTLANNGDITQTGNYNQTGNFTTSGNVAVNGGNITTTAGTAGIFESGATTINFGTTATTAINIGNDSASNLIRGSLTIGSSATNTLNIVGKFISSLIPNATNTYDLGTNLLAWRNLYLSGNYGGFWQRFSGAVSPYNITDDLLIGTTATPSAAADTGFQIFGSGTNKATASTSGNLVFYGSAPTISTQKMLPLVLGSATTGPIQLSPKGTTGLYVDGTGNVGINTTNPTAVLDVAGAASVSGTLTFRTGLGTIQTTAMNTLTLGGNTTGNISFGSHISSDFIPFTTDTYNLGSDPSTGGFEWNNLYVRQIITPATGGLAGYWQLNSGVLAPANLANDLAVGGTSTTSAVFQVFATGTNTGTASLSGNLTFQGGGAKQVKLLKNSSLGFYTSVGGDAGLTANPALFIANQENTGSIGIGTTTPLSQTGLDVQKNGLGNAVLNINQLGLGDVFTASISGATKFILNSSGYLGVGSGLTVPQGILDIASSGPLFPSDLIVGQTAATNWVANPSFEYSGNPTNTWTFNRTPEFAASNPATESALFGRYALKMDSSRDAGSTFTATSQCIPVLPSNTYTASAYAYVKSGFAGTIGINFQTYTNRDCSTGNATTGRVNTTTTNQWTRVISTITTGATVASVKVQWIADSASSGIAYLDGVQLEKSSSPTPYIDGSLGPGYSWDNRGTPNATDSSRLQGTVLAYNSLNSAAGIGAASRSTYPTLQLDQDGSGPLFVASVSGVNKFIIANNGNVGIGTTAPSAPLEVTGTIYASSFTDRDNSSYFIDPAAAGTAGAFNGNVGIGTTNPGATLEIEGTGGSSQTLKLDNTVNTTDYYTIYPNTGSGTNFGLTFKYAGTTNYLVLNNGGKSYFPTGNVGIGTTSPAAPLEVTGSIYASSFVDRDNSSYFIDPAASGIAGTFNGNVGIGTTNPGATLEIEGTGGASQTLKLDNTVNTTDYYTIYPNTGSGTNFGLTFKYAGTTNYLVLNNGGKSYFPTGNVGIGTTSPNTVLDVNGTASVSGVMTIGNGTTNQIRSAYGPLQLMYKSGLNAWSTAINVQDASGIVQIGSATNGANSTEGHIFQVRNDNNAEDGIMVQNFSTGANAVAGIGYSNNANTSEWFAGIVGTGGTNAGDFIFRNVSTASRRLRITQSGNLLCAATCQSTGSPDFAERIPVDDQSIESGDIISASLIQKETGTRSQGTYQESVIGIISENPSYIAGTQTDANLDIINTEDKLLAVAGRVPVKVTSENGVIHIGDPITTSSTPGVGMKATKAGPIIGKALGDFDPTTATQSSQLINGHWQVVNHPCQPSQANCLPMEKVLALVNVSWYDPDVFLTSTGDMHIADTTPSADFRIPHYFTLSDVLGNPITRMGAFVELVVGNLRAGSVNAQQVLTNSLAIATDNVSVAGQTLSDYIVGVVNSAIQKGTIQTNSPIAATDQIHTGIISPLSGNPQVAIRVKNSGIEIAKDASSSAVASIDNQGNATFSGTLNSQNLAVNADATISGTLHAGKIVANNIEGLSAIVGTLSAQNITNVNNIYFATPSGTPTGGNIAMGSNYSSSTNSAVLTPYLGYTNIASYSGFLAAVPNLNTDTTIVNQNFVSLGVTALGDTTITGQLSVGTNLILADSSINVLGQSLEIQPLRQGGVSFEGGLLAIDTDGNLTVNGNAVFSKTLAANIISPLSNDRNLTVQLGQNPTATGAALATSNLSVQNASGSGIFSIDQLGNVIASGAASIAKLNLNAVQPALAVSDTEVIATGSAGTTLIKPHQTEVTIDNPLVTSQSLIYITPVGQSSVTPYLLRQVNKTSFTVGIPVPQYTDTTFNWLIVN